MCSRYAEAQCCVCHRNLDQSNNRMIVEICGHQKCRECFIQEENGCSLCWNKLQECADNASVIPPPSGDAVQNDGQADNGVDSALTTKVIEDASHIIATTEHGDGTARYKCTICQKSFKSRNNCKYHLFCDKTRSRPFQCNQCDKQFITLAHMNYHQSTHSVEKHFPCTQCQKVYSGEIALKKHLKKHQNYFKYECSQCAEKFLYKEQLNVHQNRHNNIFHKCPECGKRFLIKSNLTKHIQSHTGVNRKICSICKNSFSGNSALKTHMLTHSKSKSHQCTMCSKKFIDQRTLERHEKTHFDNQFYECTLCPAKSGRKDNIRRHVRNLHSESDVELRTILQKIFENFNKKKNRLAEKTCETREKKTKNEKFDIINVSQGNTSCIQQPNEMTVTMNSTNAVRNIATSVIKFVGRSQDIQTCSRDEKRDDDHLQPKITSSTMRHETSPANSCQGTEIETRLPSSVPMTNETGTIIDPIAEIGVNLPSLEPLNFDPFPDITPLPLLNSNTNLTVYRQLLSPYLKKPINPSDPPNNASNETQCETASSQYSQINSIATTNTIAVAGTATTTPAPIMIIDRPPKKMIEKYEIFRK